jgi:hypothetical protein
VDREELVQLHAALGGLLSLPDGVRAVLVRWLTPAAKPNGHDPDPPAPKRMGRVSPRTNPQRPKAAEQRLIEAMEANPGSTVIVLARAADAGRSVTGERLRRLARDGIVEKDADGRWRLAEPTEGPTIAPPSYRRRYRPRSQIPLQRLPMRRG